MAPRQTRRQHGGDWPDSRRDFAHACSEERRGAFEGSRSFASATHR